MKTQIGNRCLMLLAAFVVAVPVSGQDTTNDRPNVLMICIDDMNDWCGFLGGHPQAKTPNIDELASKGVNFTNAHCTSPGCSPSRNALLFGIEPHRSGLYPFYDLLDVEPAALAPYTALPRLFRENGYQTCGVSKVFHNPDNQYRQDEIWDEYRMYSGIKQQVLIKDKGYHPEPYNKRTIACPAGNPLKDFGDYQTAKHAERFLLKDHDKPFFLAVGFIKPHAPFIMPEQNWDRFAEPIQPPPIKADDLIDIPLAGQSNAHRRKKGQEHIWKTGQSKAFPKPPIWLLTLFPDPLEHQTWESFWKRDLGRIHRPPIRPGIDSSPARTAQSTRSPQQRLLTPLLLPAAKTTTCQSSIPGRPTSRRESSLRSAATNLTALCRSSLLV